MKKTMCSKCNYEFSNNNIEKHFNSCDGNYPIFKKSTHCKHCKLSWDELGLEGGIGEIANHTRWCDKNPKRVEYVAKLSKIRTEYITDEVRDKMKLGISKAHKRGAYSHIDFSNSFKGKKHKPESVELIRQKALQSTHRRMRRGVSWYNGVMMDSSWEIALAKRLDELGIRWNRPDPLKWIDNEGRVRNYFPDFYLVDYNLFLDPKNKAAYENQKHKIEILKKTYTNILFILTLDECKNFSL